MYVTHESCGPYDIINKQLYTMSEGALDLPEQPGYYTATVPPTSASVQSAYILETSYDNMASQKTDNELEYLQDFHSFGMGECLRVDFR